VITSQLKGPASLVAWLGIEDRGGTRFKNVARHASWRAREPKPNRESEDVFLKNLARHEPECLAGLLISAILLYRRYYRRYFFSIGIGIADTFVAMYRFEYRQYFLTLNNVDTFSDTFAFEFA
jgi:hypothetical protein